VNLTDGECIGGRFELRQAGATETDSDAANAGAGDAVLFRIADKLDDEATEKHEVY
jgi:hypothetical protein